MEWGFTITYDRKTIRLRARILFMNDQVERIQVRARNKHIIVQSNRPFLDAKGLKQKRIDWKIIEGTISNSMVLEKILRNVEQHLKGTGNDHHSIQR